MLVVPALLLLGGCAVATVSSSSPALGAGERLAVLPFANLTDVPLAARRAQAITVSLLRQQGLREVLSYPRPETDLLSASPAPSPRQALQWARRQGARYALGGSVTEWRYKTGVDSEPAVGVVLELRDVADGRVVWSASGARSGWGYQSLAAVGQAQIQALLKGLRVVPDTARPPHSAP
jgi:TolB-like protein